MFKEKAKLLGWRSAFSTKREEEGQLPSPEGWPFPEELGQLPKTDPWGSFGRLISSLLVFSWGDAFFKECLPICVEKCEVRAKFWLFLYDLLGVCLEREVWWQVSGSFPFETLRLDRVVGTVTKVMGISAVTIHVIIYCLYMWIRNKAQPKNSCQRSTFICISFKIFFERKGRKSTNITLVLPV